MIKKKRHDGSISVIEAIDHLSAMAELDIPSSPEEIDSESFALHDGAHISENQKLVRETFRTIRDYLLHIYQDEKSEIKDPEIQRGIQAIMILVGEAAQKLDQYTSIFKGAAKESVTQLKEFKELQEVYHTKIVKRFRESGEREKPIEEEGETLSEKEQILIQKKGLKDLEMVRRDQDYELFYIRKENGHPFFTNALLRHIRLVGEFDEAVLDLEGDDPLLKIQHLEDRDALHASQSILRTVTPRIDEFCKESLSHKENEFVFHLSKAVMALMLAANPRNLLESSSGKGCLSYFKDFLLFMRGALRTEGYKRGLETLDSAHTFIHSALSLAHGLVCGFFLRSSARKEMTHFIRQMIDTSEHGPAKKRGLSLWEALSEIDQGLRHHLKSYPSGPLMKTLDTFREEVARAGFDPHLQENFPAELYTVSAEDLHVSVLKLPAPIHQEAINRAEVVGEFRAFMRGLQVEMHGQHHLLFNLQDRTSWKEHARCLVLEKLQNEAEFSKSITVVTFSKNSEFYLQTGPYQNLSDAHLFLSALQEQIKSREACGFHFPSSLDFEEIMVFVKECLEMIHHFFFSSNKILSRKNRLDFIEIFTQLFFLKIITMVKPDSVSFTCKDAIDIGEAEAATFFSFLRVLNSSAPFSREEQEFLLWALYAPALLVRHRLIDPQRFGRFISAMALLEGECARDGKAIRSAIDKLLRRPLKPELKIAA